MRLLRLFRLMDELRLRRLPVTAQDLAGPMQVSVRTIYRDIAQLQGLGAPIRGEGGVGYVMEKGFFMPSLNFETDELQALALGTRLVAARTSGGLAAAARRAAAKIASAVGSSSGDVLLEAPLAAGTSAAKPDAATGALQDQLRDAIQGRFKLLIGYVGLTGKETRRVGRPLGLTVFDTVWLLTIWCETSQDFRHLRVDRITEVAGTDERFRHEAGKRFTDALAREQG